MTPASAHLRALLAAASPRPWRLQILGGGKGAPRYRIMGDADSPLKALIAECTWDSDGPLIVAAVNALEALLARIEELEAERTVVGHGIDLLKAELENVRKENAWLRALATDTPDTIP